VPNLIQLPAGCVFRPRCSRAFEPCAARPPQSVAVGAGHAARCFLLSHD